MQTGYFGKLPFRGDFIQKNVSPSFLKLWEPWLQRVTAYSQNELHDQWLRHYLISPMWRYMVTLPNDEVYAGIVFPSVDSAGRYFPFTIVMPLADKHTAIQLMLRNQQWYNQSERLALRALDESISFEQFDQVIERLDSVFKPPLKYPSPGFHLPLNASQSLDGALGKLLNYLYIFNDRQISLWWYEDNNLNEGHFFSCLGLPDERVYTAMLTRQWDSSGMQLL